MFWTPYRLLPKRLNSYIGKKTHRALPLCIPSLFLEALGSAADMPLGTGRPAGWALGLPKTYMSLSPGSTANPSSILQLILVTAGL